MSAEASSGSFRRSSSLVFVYLMLIAAAFVAFWIIQRFGERLTAPVAIDAAVALGVGSAGVKKAPGIDVLLHVLATLAAIIGLGNLLAWLFRRIGQPAVIGEVVAGILIGPSLLGRVWPEAVQFLIPGADSDPQGLVLGSLKTVAQLGVILYMFLVGLELDIRKIGRHAHAAIAISHASIVFPFVLGAGLALWLYPILSTRDIAFTSFALFMGIAMSITAFPVLARILTDRKLERTDLGAIALSCAATDDVTAWCLLAFVVGVAQEQINGALMICAAAVAFIAVMFLVVRPIASRYVRWVEGRDLDQQAIPLLLVAVLVAAWTTEAIGIHAVFGAFLLGVMIPSESRLAITIPQKLREITTTLLLPAFFALTGMNTRVDLINGWDSWLICVVIIAIATLGKFGGTVVASRFAGVDWRTSTALGVLMNTRGLMELIVLNIGLSLGVISPTLFTMMVLMALATTMATSPILKWLLEDFDHRRKPILAADSSPV